MSVESDDDNDNNKVTMILVFPMYCKMNNLTFPSTGETSRSLDPFDLNGQPTELRGTTSENLLLY